MTKDTVTYNEHPGLEVVREKLSAYGEVVLTPDERNSLRRNGHIMATRTDLDCDAMKEELEKSEHIEKIKIRYDGMVPIYYFDVQLSK
ncbi:MAG: hypothetical protein ACOYT9_03150 [Patescibacteria group bacterium]